MASTDCLLYKWDIEAVETMAGESCVALAAAWRNLVLYSVGAAFSATCGDVSVLQLQHMLCSHKLLRLLLHHIPAQQQLPVHDTPCGQGLCACARSGRPCRCCCIPLLSDNCLLMPLLMGKGSMHVPDLCVLRRVGGPRLL